MTLALPGELWTAPGAFNDYKTLERFHYLPRRPRTPQVIRAAYFRPPGGEARCVGVALLCWPTAVSAGRDRAFGLTGQTFGQRVRFANAHVRTISRVIVHPTFRAVGLCTQLIRELIERCPTRYVEASAMMARAHPLFDRAGMTRFDPPDETRPVYFLFDRSPPPGEVQPLMHAHEH